jgi:hypothetical protein
VTTQQTLLSVMAFALLSTVLLGFQGLVLESSKDMGDSQDRIVATAMASRFCEIAESMNFDEYTVNNPIPYGNPSALTPPNKLGSDGEIGWTNFDDFDDFNDSVLVVDGGGGNGSFTVAFQVYYITPEDIVTPSPTQTFLKRMDIKVWRSDKAVTLDTVQTFITMGCYRFN